MSRFWWRDIALFARLAVVSGFVLGGAAGLSAPVFADSKVDLAVSRALDQYEQGIGSARSGVAVGNAERTSQFMADGRPAVNAAMSGPRKPQVHETEAGVETYGYDYEEFVDGERFIDLKGNFYGVFLSHTFRPNLLDPFWANAFDFLRFEGRYARGKMKYNGGGSVDYDDGLGGIATVEDKFSFSGIPDHVWEFRGLVGKEYSYLGIGLSPYMGVGFRSQTDDSSSKTITLPADGLIPERTYFGYKRSSEYYYLPIGLDVSRSFYDGWTFILNAEYDWFINGTQKSYVGSTLVNEQRKGSGGRGSITLLKDYNGVGYFISPYFRYWKIKDSDIGFAEYEGSLFAGVEPKNETSELGVKMGLRF